MMTAVSERGGRYQRSMAGMIGALIVTLGVIVAYVVFRAVNRDELDYEPEAVDYLVAVEGLQGSGALRPAYPPTLPEGWTATRASYDVETRTWTLNLLTDDGSFMGVRQSVLPEDALVEEYVGEDAEEGDELTLESPLARTWTSWSDDSDYAVVSEVGRNRVLVVGTAGRDEVEDLAASLVVRPVQD